PFHLPYVEIYQIHQKRPTHMGYHEILLHVYRLSNPLFQTLSELSKKFFSSFPYQTQSSGHNCKYRSAPDRRQSAGYNSNPKHVRKAIKVDLPVPLSVGKTLPSFVGHPHIPRSVSSSLTAEASHRSPI